MGGPDNLLSGSRSDRNRSQSGSSPSDGYRRTDKQVVRATREARSYD